MKILQKKQIQGLKQPKYSFEQIYNQNKLFEDIYDGANKLRIIDNGDNTITVIYSEGTKRIFTRVKDAVITLPDK